MSVEIKTIKGFIGYENEVIPQSEQVTVRFTSDRNAFDLYTYLS